MKEVTIPLIVLNFKAYPEVFGEKGVQLAKIAEKVSDDLGISIVICPPVTYLAKYAEILNIPVFSQNLDNVVSGSSSGKVSVEMIKESGASGALINCPENKTDLTDLESIVRISRTHRLFTIVCTSNEAISAAVTKLDPHAIAFGSPELNEPGVSVSTARPEFIQNHVKRIKLENPRVSPLCGTGIYSYNDVEKALKFGIEGILIASVFIQAKDPYELLNSMAKCFIS
jgi:triosephosphate isomerase